MKIDKGFEHSWELLFLTRRAVQVSLPQAAAHALLPSAKIISPAAVLLKDMQHELEQLTKELRQVNLQQFIKQTGTKVTVLPAEPAEEGSAHNSPGIGKEMFPSNENIFSSFWGVFFGVKDRTIAAFCAKHADLTQDKS